LFQMSLRAMVEQREARIETKAKRPPVKRRLL